MLPRKLRRRLLDFLSEHDEVCDEEPCVVTSARRWAASMRKKGYPEEELILLGMAFLAYRANKEIAERQLDTYQASIATVVARNGGTLEVCKKDVESLPPGSTMTTQVAPDGLTVTYRLVREHLPS